MPETHNPPLIHVLQETGPLPSQHVVFVRSQDILCVDDGPTYGFAEQDRYLLIDLHDPAARDVLTALLEKNLFDAATVQAIEAALKRSQPNFSIQQSVAINRAVEGEPRA